MDDIAYAGRLAVITGAGSGIGRALALAAARRAMTVALADIDEAKARETLEMVVAEGGGGLVQRLDVRDADALAGFAATAIARFGSPAAIFANAGVLKYASTIRPDLQSWRLAVDVNLIGTVNTIAAFLPPMLEAGDTGQLVITGSMGSFVAAPELAAYTATKHSLWALAQCLRMELADQDKVGVSLLAPPRVDTPLLAESVARTRAAQGDASAHQLRASAMSAATIAQYALDGAKARSFYIVPQIADVAPIIRRRIDELLQS